MSFMDKMKKAGKSVVDAGAKTMLKVRTVCLLAHIIITRAMRCVFLCCAPLADAT